MPLTHFTGFAGKVQELTASGVVNRGVNALELNHASTSIAATIADPTYHQILCVKQIDAGTAGHTVVLTSGTWDGTNDTITLDADLECIIVIFDSAGDGTIIENVGSVSLS